jgi:hypothetical protein
MKKEEVASSSSDEDLIFTKNRRFLGILLILFIFILLINISFISASQKYTLESYRGASVFCFE